MSPVTVSPAEQVSAAIAHYEAWDTDSLSVRVGSDAFCIADPAEPRESRMAWEEQWLVPAAHPHIPDHVWRDRVEILARHLCGPCPVREACLALSERDPKADDGWIAGGLAPHQRRTTAGQPELASAA